VEVVTKMNYLNSILFGLILCNLTTKEASNACDPSISHLNIFGCEDYTHAPKVKKKNI